MDEIDLLNKNLPDHIDDDTDIILGKEKRRAWLLNKLEADLTKTFNETLSSCVGKFLVM